MDVGTRNPIRAARPDWLPDEHTLAAVAAGRWWDAIRVEGDLGTRLANTLLDAQGRRCGPVVRDPLGPRPTTYFLVAAGTSARWAEPGTEALGVCCYVVLPGNLDGDTRTVHWVSPPRDRLVGATTLRRLLPTLREVPS
ncbi:hypothetical protein [Streptomyces sp. JJ38]|uniref:hypothetical protein n=1 Tax=Streptomyces sp. JJ38 TaxID=2738128 RepID=UPI001C585794|nr:hypothetical protein [Streptomyces sp. JJ38]MBW1598253.1 hypothetical protein [Streptomyces sp. JJ38]